MAKFTKNISDLVNQQVPEFVLEQHPKFLQFVKSYYTFMESAELSVKNIEQTDGILLETETNQENNLLLDASRIDSDRTQLDAGDKVILENSSFGKFTRGETITGQTSNATATVLTEDLTNNRLFISAQDKFINGETVVGSSSNATAVINGYKPNPVNSISDLVNFRDPDKVISNYLTKFRNEFLNSLPENLNSSVDKRKLIKNIKSLYRAKGTSRGHELFFKLLFNEDSETKYPRENVLRVSDGKWDTKTVLRAIGTEGDTVDLVGRTITGQSSEATAVIENAIKFQIGASEVTEFTINTETTTGTFTVGEEIRGTQTDTDDTFIKATITGIPSTLTISNDGHLYSNNEDITITGGGQSAIVQVEEVGAGGITEFVIDDGGSNYEIGDDLVFTSSTGSSADAKVAVVNGGITLEEGTESSSTSHIVLEDETTSGDSYTGNKIVQESGSGDITDIRITNPGFGYATLPTVTVTSTSGSSASIKAYGSQIGRVLGLKVVEFGSGYENSPTPPTLSFKTRLIFSNKSVADFVVNESVSATGSDGSTTITGTLSSIDTDTNVMTISSATGTFGTNVTITGADSGATATIEITNQATASTTVAATATTSGSYINQDGHISEDTMRIQDSLYYQDFSYVIKVGETINTWRDSFEKTMHTSGFYFTGEVNIQLTADAQISSPVEGLVTGTEDVPIFSIINTLYSTIFGRRLGTEDDGTTLRANPELGVDPDFDDSTSEHFTANTRDVTLKRKYTISMLSVPRITVRSEDLLFGYAMACPRMKSLDMYDNPFGSDNLFSGSATTASTSSIDISGGGGTTVTMPLTFETWKNHRLTGLNSTSLDGEVVQIADYNNDDLKTYIAYPSEIKITTGDNTFDETTITFDTTNITFDAA